jgi:predicted metal-dependent hydrolase
MIPLRPAVTGELREIDFGRTRLSYELVTSATMSLAISVYPDLRIRVVVPHGVDPQQVDARVRKRGQWIIKQMEFFRQFLPHPVARRYVSGETHYYLGRQYRLKVTQVESQEPVLLKGGYIQVHTPDRNDSEDIRRRLDTWYRARAKAVFRFHLDRCLKRLEKHGIRSVPMRVQRMRGRWGSYTPSGTIILNLDLIKAPSHCIEYVIIHELCHTKIPSHGPDFEHLLTRCLPDWRKRKERLEQTVVT